MLQRLVSVADSFVPERMVAAGPEEIRRARVAVLIAWLMGTMFAAVLVMRVAAAEWHAAMVDVGLVICCFLAPYLLRWTGQYALIVGTTLGAVFALLCWLGYTNPNPGLNAATMALAEIPLFAIILFGPRVGYVWSAASGLAVLLIGISDFAIPLVPTATERAAFNEYWAAVIMSMTLVSAGVFYERGKDDSLRRIQQLDTERRESELTAVRAETDAKLQQAERFASLGRLAAAVAHEVNNPLSYVKGNLLYVSNHTPPATDDEIRRALAEALDGVERIRRIVEDMRGLTRPSEDATAEADVRRAIRSAVAIADTHTRAKANLQMDIEPHCYARCDEPRLSQAVLNLLINSAQALLGGRKNAHTIAVRARRIDDMIRIEVEDNGPGVPAAIVDRVREPLFTTKPVGEGTGLGLALVEGIMRSYGGTLDIESRPGRTVVTLTLPAIDRMRARQVRSISYGEEIPLRILICDDDPMVARAIRRHLSVHDVHVVSGGQQALDWLDGDEDVDLVLCDMMMPEVSGMDVYDRVAGSLPHLAQRFVFMSGGVFTERAVALKATPGVRFIKKPISIDDLRAVVREAMRRVAADRHPQHG